MTARRFFAAAALAATLVTSLATTLLAPAFLSPAWAADRQLPNSGSVGPVTGPAYMDAVADEVTALWNAAPLTLTSVGGTADAITANVAPPLTGSIVDGMAFYLTPVATNTGAATLKIGTGSALAVVDSAGTALASGALQSGQTYHLLYRGTPNKFHILGPSQAPGALAPDFQIFTSNGTWTKPVGASTNTLVFAECWGGGGGGSVSTTGGGGGGGAYNARWFRASELAATEAVSIGNGGTVGTAGSTSSLGSKLSAFGGGGAGSGSNNGGGGGGGPDSQGLSNTTTTGGAGGGFSNGIGGVNGSPSTKGQNAVGGGGGGAGVIGTGAQGGDGYFGGGGGGGGGSSTGGGGGNSHFGGGGGAGNGNVNGGFSTFGGAGGGSTVVGTAPGGGGGRNAAGARGECRVTTR